MQTKAQELLNYPLDTINGEEVYKYEVERSVGLYRIGVNFNVAQSDIVRLNPQLRERGLHYGEILYLPTGRKVGEKAISIQPSEVSIQPTETVVAVADTIVADSIVADTVIAEPDTIEPDLRPVVELALMLPFESQQSKRSGNAERMMEFYQGALLALYGQQNDSIKYRLRVYDTERSERRVSALCDSTELDSVRGVLGLVYPIQIERMISWSESHGVPMLLPFSDDMNLSHHPTLLQFNSTDQQEADSLCRWISNQDSAVHCVAVDTKEAEIAATIRTLRKALQAQDIEMTALPLQDLLLDSAAYALDSLKENLIILHSDRYQHARIVLPHLVALQQAGFRIRIVSQYSWQKENIALPQVYTSMFREEEDREAYETLWRTYFTDEHVSQAPRYDILGYDLMNALIDRLNGKNETRGLQSTIRWEQVNEGGYQNACVHVVTY
jgi:hypothetical protein